MASELRFDKVTRTRWDYGGHIGIAASVLQNVGVAGVVVTDWGSRLGDALFA
jgi:hypothetical protein